MTTVMREWITLIEELDIRLHLNPTPTVFLTVLDKVKNLRGTINGSDVWLWPALEAAHGDIDRQVGIDKTLGVVDLRVYTFDTPVSAIWQPAVVTAPAFKWGAYLRVTSAEDTEEWNRFSRGQAIAERHPVFSRYLAIRV